MIHTHAAAAPIDLAKATLLDWLCGFGVLAFVIALGIAGVWAVGKLSGGRWP